jgi:tetratricopeptide (TPR) repeat protein
MKNFNLKFILYILKFIIIFLLLSTNMSFGSELDKLFFKIKNAPSYDIALKYETKVWQYWYNEGSSKNSNLIMKKCLINFQNGSLEKALNCFVNLHKLEQNWAEPLNKLATIKFMMGDYEGALKDIRLTLQKEPRHFGAIAGLVQINVILKKYDKALKHLDTLKQIHPHISILSLRPVIQKLLKKSLI